MNNLDTLLTTPSLKSSKEFSEKALAIKTADEAWSFYNAQLSIAFKEGWTDPAKFYTVKQLVCNLIHSVVYNELPAETDRRIWDDMWRDAYLNSPWVL